MKARAKGRTEEPRQRGARGGGFGRGCGNGRVQALQPRVLDRDQVAAANTNTKTSANQRNKTAEVSQAGAASEAVYLSIRVAYR